MEENNNNQEMPVLPPVPQGNGNMQHGQPNYIVIQAPQPQGEMSPTVTKGEWLCYLLLQCIPFINIIALFIFAFGGDKPSRANLAKATLILYLLAFGIAVAMIVLLVFVGRECTRELNAA